MLVQSALKGTPWISSQDERNECDCRICHMGMSVRVYDDGTTGMVCARRVPGDHEAAAAA